MKLLLRLFYIFLLVQTAEKSLAQVDTMQETAISPYQSYSRDQLGAVNNLNGVLSMDIPLFSLPQKGALELKYWLHIQGGMVWNAWQEGSNTPNPITVWQPFSGFGPVITSSYAFQLQEFDSTEADGFTTDVADSTTDPDGGKHDMLYDVRSGVEHSYDGSGYAWLSSGLALPNGVVISQGGVKDRSGNQIQLSYSGSPASVPATITDSAGRSFVDISNFAEFGGAYYENHGIPAYANTDTSGCPSVGDSAQQAAGSYAWQVPGANGKLSTYLICYTKIYYQITTVNQSQGVDFPIQSVVLPDKTYWLFHYNSTDSSYSTIAYGSIDKITTPGGATAQYHYIPTPTCLADGGWTQNIGIDSRTFTAGPGGNVSSTGTWKTSYDSGAASSSSNIATSTTVTDPYGNDEVLQYARQSGTGKACALFPVSDKKYNGSASANQLLSSQTTAYLQTNTDPTSTALFTGVADSILPNLITNTIGDVSTSTAITYDDAFDSGAYYNSAGETGYHGVGYIPLGFKTSETVSGFDGSVLRTTLTHYLWQTHTTTYLDQNLLQTPDDSSISGPNGTEAETINNYDEIPYDPGTNLSGHLTSVISGVGAVSVETHTVWNAAGQVDHAIDALGHKTNQIVYGAAYNGLYPTSVTDTAGHETDYTYDFNTGSKTSIKDPNRNTTTFSYFDNGRQKNIIYPDSGETDFTYASDSGPITASNPLAVQSSEIGSIAGPMVSKKIFDGFGDLTESQQMVPEGTILIDSAYDAKGQLLSETNPYLAGSSPDGATSYSYDALGRTLLQCQQDNGTWPNACSAGNAYISTSYSGNMHTVKDEAGNATTYTVDALGRTQQVNEASNAITTYTHDARGNLTGVMQAGISGDVSRQRSFMYDPLSRLVTSTNPETGTICYGQWSGGSVGSGTCQNGYDANGNLISKTDARGITTTYSYDALNRLISKTYSDGSIGAWFGYDGKSTNGGSLGQPSLNAVGRLSQQSNFVNIASTFSYDPMGRLSQVTQCIPTDCSYDISTSASYDLAGNMVSMTYPDGRTVQNVWDAAGRLSNVNYLSWGTTNVNQPYFSESNGYDPAGHLTAGAFGNGVPMSAAYDNRERMINLAYGPTTGPLWSKQYAWTPNSNMQSATDLITGVQRQFAYDNLNRLTTAQDIYSSLAVPSSSNGNTVSTTTSGSAATETPGTSGAFPQWTDTDDSNLLTDIGASDSTWLFANAVVAPNAAMAPDGSMTATTVTATSGSVDTYVSGPVSSPADYSLETVSGSVWLRSFSGTQIINIFITDDIPGTYQVPGMTQILLTTQWQQFKVTGSVLGNNLTGLALQIGGGGSVTDGGGFMMWNPMLEDEGHSGSSVTNFAPYSQLMTAATWASSQGTVSPDTVPAPDGTNTGATLTANAGTTDNWVVDTVSNPAPLGGIAITGSIWLRAPSGTQQINMNLAEVGNSGANNIANTTFTVTADWQRFQITGITQSMLNQLQLQIGGGNTFTNGEVIYAWGAQLEMASTAGPYVATANAPVTMGTSMTNLLSYSQDATQWLTAAVSVAASSVAAPDGSITAARLTSISGDSAVGLIAPDAGLYDGETVTASVYLKSESGQPTINIYPYSIINGVTQYLAPLSATLSTTWQRFQITGTLPNGVSALALQIGGAGSFSNGEVVDAWGPQMEIAPQAGPYVATSALPIIAGRTLTNILPNSQAISGPDWTLNSGSVSANSSSAPDGTNTATTFSANAGSGDSYLAAFVPNPSLYDGQTVTSSVYLRAISGTQNVNLYLINVGNQGWAIASQATLSLTTSWQRFTLTSSLQNGLQSLYLQIGGGGTVVGGQGYEIWGAQFNVGSDPTPYTSTPSTATVYATGASGTPVTNGLNQTYAYDSFGNILQNGSFNTTYTANNQMYAYPYDAAGNLLSDRVGNNMTWDAESRLSSVAGATYLYDGDGNRVEKQGSSVTDTIYFGGRPIARLSGGQWTDLIYGPNGLLAEVPGTQTASPMYRVADNLGTDVGSLLANGSFVNPIDHSPFGQTISGLTNDPYFLTGKERDAESGNDYFGARYYASSMGRFSSPDPSVLDYADFTNPQSLNLYSYALNNPLKFIDPTGLDQCIWDDGSRDDEPGDGGATQQECSDQGGNWAGGTDASITVTATNSGNTITTYDMGYMGGQIAFLPGAGCSAALSTAHANGAAMNRYYNQYQGTVNNAADANGIDPGLLGAIGVRETGMQNIPQSGGGKGAGVFQVDLGAHPNVSSAQAYNVDFSANFAGNMLSSNMNFLAAAHPNLNGTQLAQATASTYNMGLGKHGKNISGNPNTIDKGTTGGNYGSNVVALMNNCFH